MATEPIQSKFLFKFHLGDYNSHEAVKAAISTIPDDILTNAGNPIISLEMIADPLATSPTSELNSWDVVLRTVKQNTKPSPNIIINILFNNIDYTVDIDQIKQLLLALWKHLQTHKIVPRYHSNDSHDMNVPLQGGGASPIFCQLKGGLAKRIKDELTLNVPVDTLLRSSLQQEEKAKDKLEKIAKLKKNIIENVKLRLALCIDVFAELDLENLAYVSPRKSLYQLTIRYLHNSLSNISNSSSPEEKLRLASSMLFSIISSKGILNRLFKYLPSRSQTAYVPFFNIGELVECCSLLRDKSLLGNSSDANIDSFLRFEQKNFDEVIKKFAQAETPLPVKDIDAFIAKVHCILKEILEVVSELKEQQTVHILIDFLGIKGLSTEDEINKLIDEHPLEMQYTYQLCLQAKKIQPKPNLARYCSPSPQPSYSTYQKIWDKTEGNVTTKAIAILKNYNKKSGLFFDKHHTAEFKKIINKIERGKLSTLEEIVRSLAKIKLTNPEGSAAAIVYFLSIKLGLLQMKAVETSSALDQQGAPSNTTSRGL